MSCSLLWWDQEIRSGVHRLWRQCRRAPGLTPLTRNRHPPRPRTGVKHCKFSFGRSAETPCGSGAIHKVDMKVD
jgi:hypothetical protein